MKLRTHIRVLILGILVPMVLFSAGMLVWVHRQTRAATERGLLDTARAMSVAVDKELGGTVAALKLLATSEHLREGNLKMFHRAAHRAVSTQPTWQNVVLYAPAGRPLVNTLLPLGAPVPATAYSEPVKRAFLTRRPAISDLFMGRLTNRPLISIVIPVYDGDAPRYGLAAIVTAEALHEVLRQQQIPQDWVVTLTDRTGIIIARTRREDTKEGGGHVYAAFSRSAVSGWVVAIGAPASMVDAPLRDQLALLALAGTCFALLGTFIAGAVGRRIAEPLLSLSSAAARLARGEPVSVSKTSVTEVNAVMLAMEAASRERLRIEELTAANRLKSEFLANMSHELRTPLNGIIGFAEVMHDGKVGPVSAEHKEYLGDILTSARHLLLLINDVLDLSKIESGKMEFHPRPVETAGLVSEVRHTLRALAAQKQIDVHEDVDPRVSTLITDPSKLKQVLYNYASNALKFTPDGGRVTIRVEPEGDENVRIEVEDTGIGIRSEDIPKLFVEFQQLDASAAKKYQGTGLGLALTKRIVEAQGGHVGVRSVPGCGSAFFAVLPRTAAQSV